MKSLFSQVARDFSISRIARDDAARLTDRWRDLRALVLRCEPMYPHIDRWVDDRLRHGIGAGRHSAFVGYHLGRPVVSSVVKRGRLAKFCHLKVDDDLQRSHIGEFFFALMAMEVLAEAEQIHFTLPEGLWSSKRDFFSGFAFGVAERSGRQYRLFEDELHCAAPANSVWKSVVRKLPRLRAVLSIDSCSQDTGLLLSVKPRHARAILEGRKRVEIRRKFPSKWEGSRLTLYASQPTSSVVGEAIAERLIRAEPTCLWREFSSSLGCTKEEFDTYTAGSEEAIAIVLSNVRSYATPMPLETIRALVDRSLRPPQSYAQLLPESPWAQAIPIVSLLQATTWQAPL